MRDRIDRETRRALGFLAGLVIAVIVAGIVSAAH